MSEYIFVEASDPGTVENLARQMDHAEAVHNWPCASCLEAYRDGYIAARKQAAAIAVQFLGTGRLVAKDIRAMVPKS